MIGAMCKHNRNVRLFMNICELMVLLAIFLSDGGLSAMNASGQECVGKHGESLFFSPGHRFLKAAKLSEDGNRFLIAVNDGELSDAFVYEINTGKMLWKLALPDPVSSATLSPNKKAMALSFALHSMECPHVESFDASNGEKLPLENPGGNLLGDSVQKVNFSADGRLLAASLNFEIVVWDISTGRIVSEIVPPGFETRQGIDSPKELVFSPNGKYIAGTSDRYPIVYLWNLKSRNLIRSFTLDKFSGVFGNVVFSNDGSLLAVGTSGPLVIWNTRTGGVVAKIMKPVDGPISPVTFIKPEKLVVSGIVDLKLWDVSKRKPVPIQDLKPPGVEVDAVLPLGTGRLVGLTSNGAWEKNPGKPLEIRLIEIPSGKVISTLQVPGRVSDSGRKDSGKRY